MNFRVNNVHFLCIINHTESLVHEFYTKYQRWIIVRNKCERITFRLNWQNLFYLLNHYVVTWNGSMVKIQTLHFHVECREKQRIVNQAANRSSQTRHTQSTCWKADQQMIYLFVGQQPHKLTVTSFDLFHLKTWIVLSIISTTLNTVVIGITKASTKTLLTYRKTALNTIHVTQNTIKL